MLQSFEQYEKYIQEHHIQLVDFKFCDLWGRWHRLTVPASQVTPSILERGIGFDGSAIVFSEELIQQWISYKLEAEYYQVRNRPHPYEISLYFNV